MPKHMFVERRQHRREEEVTVPTAAEEQHERERQHEIADEVAELDATTDEVLAHIDEVLSGLGHVSIQAA